MAKDLYAVLGLSKSASADDIKRAYRKLSKEWHPDKHKGDKAAEDKFKEINEAYETLSDPQKKQMYDQFGSVGGAPGGGAGGFGGFDFSGFQQGGGFGDFGDLFENFFSGGSPRGRADRTRGADREIELAINFADVLTGVHETIDLRHMIVCDVCGGNGAEPGSSIIQCPTCGGTGQVVHSVQSFFGQIQQRGICPQCQGAGTVPEKPCHKCHGEGRVNDRSRVTIDIPAGIDNGQQLRIRGQGDAGTRGGESGDLFVLIRVRPDPRFTREGIDIRSSVTVPVIDAMLGGTVEVETVHGTSTLTIPEGTQPNQVLRIKGKGFPRLGSSHVGDHFVTINVEIPKKLSRSERKILEEWREKK
ncbi:MAG TPA: molecular chaperone DnaJ [Candidatus Peribacteraceae bacterium]|nr:molecular chaperone DnaJ [Candidatus Peribacteraceae bacterium]